ncbi:helix-turn-helix domain-containing protein [Clostridium tagluense]|uniref:helix-turn-helix domain-containing protein n=1 Tax=Clostridium tagluense TaxID=360422 RepID=UPI001CF5C394|nr:helix-turn-helix transcriptional regulator [Clostridium tagluense]MCB2313591.1 helix-turn-helix domain-containing protein [Clostridium tagluense]MCB2318455.1 helix-turn-helix domain-containing protein [Clostridium tagluense]MCB2323256.1 helix-turn-helix domain-containing protein [Clostridium tagluense]MCB2328199.1 helix-turn-helix domain-containing protein [Clostridium tagluense]MCB2332936.1 helix-turn-helix domain-containing protein [Clostridium tagluense]
MIKLSFSEKLQRLRKEKALSQEQLAELLNVSRQSVSKWESGQTYPEINKLIILSDLFKITMDDLVKDKNTLCVYNEDVEREEDDGESSLMVGGMIVGMAIGFITDNYIWSMVGVFLPVGVTYIIKGIKEVKGKI